MRMFVFVCENVQKNSKNTILSYERERVLFRESFFPPIQIYLNVTTFTRAYVRIHLHANMQDMNISEPPLYNKIKVLQEINQQQEILVLINLQILRLI
jgi:hypothetical protein